MNESLTQEQAKELWNQLEDEDAPDAGASTGEMVDSQHQEQAAEPNHDAADAASQEAPADDPYANLPPHIKDELIGLKTVASQLSSRLRNVEGHVGGLKSQLQAQMEAAKEIKAAGGSAPSATEIREAQANPEAFQKLTAEYPEFSEAIESLVDSRIQRAKPAPQGPSVSKDDIARMREELRAEVRQELADARVETHHENWKATVVTPAFIGWFQQQPQEIQALAASHDPADVIRVLDRFAGRRGKPPAQNRSIQSAAALPNGRANAIRSKPVEEMTPQEFWDYQDQVEASSPHRR